MEIPVRTVTPIWTGGPETGKIDRIYETGVLGSLRWWYEVMVRGLGGWVSDPTERDGSCLDVDKYKKSGRADPASLRDAGLCDVSQVFGATGWRRRFRLVIQDGTTPDSSIPAQIHADRTYTRADGTPGIPTWYFAAKPRSGRCVLRIESLDATFPAEIIGGLLRFVAEWAALGAKTQFGFGVVELLSGPVDTRPLYDRLALAAGTRTYDTLPSLRNVFLARIQASEKRISETFNLKHDLRRLFMNDADVRHFVMGTAQGDRMAAKIKMSRPYGDGLMRVWGWVPRTAKCYGGRWDRDKIMTAIHDHLLQHYDLKDWREFDSQRDTSTPNNDDRRAFLRSLLGLEEVDDAA